MGRADAIPTLASGRMENYREQLTGAISSQPQRCFLSGQAIFGGTVEKSSPPANRTAEPVRFRSRICTAVGIPSLLLCRIVRYPNEHRAVDYRPSDAEDAQTLQHHADIEAKREKMKLLPNFLNLAGEPVEAEQLLDCSQDPEVTALLKNIRASISNELKQRLEYLATAGIKAVVGLRHKLTE